MKEKTNHTLSKTHVILDILSKINPFFKMFGIKFSCGKTLEIIFELVAANW